MSVSSISSYSSTLWEEYLEQLQKKQQQRKDGAALSKSEDIAASALSGLVSEPEEAADFGGLSVIQENFAGSAGAVGPKGPPPGGMSGASGISSKLMEALIEEEDDASSSDANTLISKIKASMSNQLSAIYTQRQIQSSTVSLSG
jgi:hypothetical protein